MARAPDAPCPRRRGACRRGGLGPNMRGQGPCRSRRNGPWALGRPTRADGGCPEFPQVAQPTDHFTFLGYRGVRAWPGTPSWSLDSIAENRQRGILRPGRRDERHLDQLQQASARACARGSRSEPYLLTLTKANRPLPRSTARHSSDYVGHQEDRPTRGKRGRRAALPRACTRTKRVQAEGRSEVPILRRKMKGDPRARPDLPRPRQPTTRRR